MKLVKLLVIICFGVIAVAFSVVNRQAVELFFPLSDYSVEIPLYLLFFAVFLVSVFFGGLISYLLALKVKLELRSCKKRLEALEKSEG